jgi:phosphoserine/homoserine phosphotransferase
MYILCSDLEGVFVPEIWINVALATGIEELKLTTRDINNYDVLMKGRLDILRQNKLTIHDIQKVIKGIDPLPGAVDFISWIKKRTGLIIVSDTFIEFADPLMEKLGRPTLLCNSLTIDKDGNITNYNLRQSDGKRKVTEALHNLNYKSLQ